MEILKEIKLIPVGNLFAAEGAARPLAAAVDVAAGSPNVRLQEFVAVESDVLFVIVFDVCPLHKLIFFCGGGEQLPFLKYFYYNQEQFVKGNLRKHLPTNLRSVIKKKIYF